MHLYTNSGSPSGKRTAIVMKEKGIEIPTTEIDLRKRTVRNNLSGW